MNRHGRAVGRAGPAQPVQRPGRVERVQSDGFFGSGVGPASSGGGATISPPTSAAVVAAGDRSSSRHVDNPAYDVQGAYEDMLDPDAIDGGYMDVVGEESDVSLITDGLDRQESDVSLITDPGIMPRRLGFLSEI